MTQLLLEKLLRSEPNLRRKEPVYAEAENSSRYGSHKVHGTYKNVKQ